MTSGSAMDTDVVVVGAGLAGLAAARSLQAAGRGVVVLEALPEVGGRARTRLLDGLPVDLGGEWVGRGHRRVQRLAGELGIGVERAGTLGGVVRWRLPSGEHLGRLPPRRTWRGFVRLVRRAARDSAGIDPTAPWTGHAAPQLDDVSLAAWLTDVGVTGDARLLVEQLVGSLSSSPTEEMSLLQFLWWMRMAGGPLRTVHTTFGCRLVGGAQQLAQRMAESLPVRVDSPVREVRQDGDSVWATAADGTTCSARAAVVAVPLPVLGRISFDPPLPHSTSDDELPRVRPGLKVVALLPPDHPDRVRTVLGGATLWGAWRVGRRVTGFAPPQAQPRAEDLVADLADAFRVAPSDLTHVLVQDWAEEPTIAGCDVAFAPGQVCRWGPLLRRPHGRVRFAGSERSSWPNNMEGALESGDAAARGAVPLL